MLRILLALVAAAFALPAFANPFLFCDLVTDWTHYAVQFCTARSTDDQLCITWGTWGVDQPRYGTAPPYNCRHDLAGIATGAHIVRAKGVHIDPLWGRTESAPSIPLAFKRPGSQVAPSGLTLTP